MVGGWTCEAARKSQEVLFSRSGCQKPENSGFFLNMGVTELSHCWHRLVTTGSYSICMKAIQNQLEEEKFLIQAAQRGDLNAFNELVLHYQNLLFGIALRMLGDEDIASDAVQEALISAFSKFNTFRGGSLKSWLARVTINACYDEMRRKRRQREMPMEQFNTDG